MEAALRKEPGLPVETITLVQGDRGIFEVRADDELLFSKKAAGRFPTHAEIVKAIRDRPSV